MIDPVDDFPAPETDTDYEPDVDAPDWDEEGTDGE